MKLNKTSKGQYTFWFLLLISCFINACDPDPKPTPTPGSSDQFETSPQKVEIKSGVIDEASGLTESVALKGYLWTMQDSGQPASLYLLSKDGQSIKPYNIPGASNHDWEDIASGPGPTAGINYLYVADIGNNNLPMRETNIIYRMPEINEINGSFNGNQLEKIRFRYPDGPRDAETILLDSTTRDIFIISKESANTGIYRLAYPQSVSEIITAEKMGTMPGATTVTAGDISLDGAEIVIRTYTNVYYWKRKKGETIANTLSQAAAKQLSVALEPQGEAICFDRTGNGFYTLSEKGTATSVTLNFYKRK